MVDEEHAATSHRATRAPDTAPCAWVSNAAVKSLLGFGFTCQLAQDDEDAFVALIRAAKRGEVLSSADLPAEMWIDPMFHRDNRRTLPHLFKANGFFAVSGPFADVLRDFDLGRTRLHPVELLHLNRKARFEGQYYLLTIGEVHQLFLPDQSTHWRPLKGSRTTYIASIPMVPQDDDLTLAPAALTGPALWLDNTIGATLFFSDPLVQALRAAKLTSKLPLYRCRVATMN